MRNKKSKRKSNLTIKLIYILFSLVIVINITLARYQTTIVETTSATAANWLFKLAIDDQILSQNFQINLQNTIDNSNNNVINSGVIAPSSTGNFTLNIDCTECEVGVLYSIELSDPNKTIPNGLKFYSSSTYEADTEITLNSPYEETLDLNQTSQIREETIYWKWNTGDEQNININDTLKNDETIGLNIKVTGTQLLNNLNTDEKYFDISASGKVTINLEEVNNFKDEVTTLNIPAIIRGVPVTEICPMAFANFTSLNSVSINSERILIGQGAFSGCSNISTVTILSSNITIGDNVFDGCENLRRIHFGGDITSVGKWAFKDCKQLQSINLPNTVTTIGESAFYNCTSLDTITIPENINTIDKWTFWNCSELNNIIIPNNVINIQEGAFAKCIALSTITIGTGVQTIGDSAFYDCLALEEITIPNNVLTIEDYAFQECINLTTATIENTNATVSEKAFFGCTNLEN
ncbi:MAG: leucine-rich repeat domain-containing protein [Clostridia bacterium]|nr:leucine-rich repeat domain-containing protein [Clostridia bacterium]